MGVRGHLALLNQILPLDVILPRGGIKLVPALEKAIFRIENGNRHLLTRRISPWA
jgi:hypothetical protein